MTGKLQAVGKTKSCIFSMKKRFYHSLNRIKSQIGTVPYHCLRKKDENIWHGIHHACLVGAGELTDRTERKMHQLANMLRVVCHISKPGDTIVDFCGGKYIRDDAR